LHLAVANKNYEMVEWLIQNKANIAIEDMTYNTPLTIAQNFGFRKIALILIAQIPYYNYNLSHLNQGNPQERLLAAIQEIHNYGMLLKTQGMPKGQVAIELADKLKLKACDFFKNENNIVNLPQFKNEFLLLLHSKDREMRDYRVCWNTIIVNTAIALSGIGALLMIAHLLYSKVNEGRALFFFQKKMATCEEKIDVAKRSLNEFN
jgi:hypothetical protein